MGLIDHHYASCGNPLVEKSLQKVAMGLIYDRGIIRIPASTRVSKSYLFAKFATLKFRDIFCDLNGLNNPWNGAYDLWSGVIRQ